MPDQYSPDDFQGETLLNICFLSEDYPAARRGGGVGTQVRTLARALVQAGHHVTVVALGEPGIPDVADDEGVRVVRFHRGNLHWYVSRMPFFGSLLARPVREVEEGWAGLREVRGLHKTEPFDVIEGTETGTLGVALALRDVPLVIRLHGERYTFHQHTPDLDLSWDIRFSRWLQRLAIRRADALISPSHAHAREIQSEVSRLRGDIEVVQNCLPPGSVNRSVHRVGNRADQVGPIVLFTGRLERAKGIPWLLRAAQTVTEQLPDVRFVLAGASHPTLPVADIKDLIRSLGIEEYVRLIGHVPADELSDWYQRASVCVLPSFYESFGLSALEAMAHGVPVVASAAGALPEVIRDGESGYLVPPGDSPSLAGAIISLLEDGDLRRRMGEAGQRRASQFGVAPSLHATLDVYRRVTSAPDSTQRSFDDLALLHGDGGSTTHVFLSPHYDDAVLSCGGLIARLVGVGAPVHVWSLFTSERQACSAGAFARHLTAKWGLQDADDERDSEDAEALRLLGVAVRRSLGLADAPTRLDSSGRALYCSYDQLRGEIAAADADLAQHVVDTVRSSGKYPPDGTVFYCPLGLGDHVDHRLGFRAGTILREAGYRVLFYEDWPYLEGYRREAIHGAWVPRDIEFDLDTKTAAAARYRSQLRGLGGSTASLRGRLAKSSSDVRKGRCLERYWEPSGPFVPAVPPLRPAAPPPWSRLLRAVRSSLHPLRMSDLVPVGMGVGTELADPDAPAGQTPSLIVLREGSCPSSDPDRVIRDAARALGPGGVVVGRFARRNPNDLIRLYTKVGDLLHRCNLDDISISLHLIFDAQDPVERHAFSPSIAFSARKPAAR